MSNVVEEKIMCGKCGEEIVGGIDAGHNCKGDQTTQVKTESLAVVQQAKAMKVTDDSSFRAAGEFLKQIKIASNKVIAVFKPMKTQAHKAWRTICDTEGEMLDPLNEAEKYLKSQLSDYTLKVEEEQASQRKELENKARSEADESTLEAAYAAEEAGSPALAQEILRQEPHVPAVVMPSAAPAMKGISTRKKYKSQIVNMRALCAAVATGKVPIMAILGNTKWLDTQANQMQDLLNIPGVKAVPENIIAVRTK